MDRRRIRDRIAKLERELVELSRGRFERRRRRVKAGIPIVSSSATNAVTDLLNTLTRSSVFTEDLLATPIHQPENSDFQGREVIITDTVGFIRSLPNP
jgi:GTP-binding protein HflX